MIEFFRQNPRAAETLRGPMFEEKVVDFILELAKVEEQTGHAGGTGGEPEPGRADADRRRQAGHGSRPGTPASGEA